MIIYKVTNIVNNKIYIGQTIKSLNLRRKIHEETPLKYCAYFQKAIKKYGKESFVWEELEICQTREQLNKQEKFWIKFYNSNESKFGYNLTNGGDSFEFNEATKKKISESITGEKNGFYGKKHLEETKQKVSIANKGKKRSDTYKKLLSENVSGDKNPFYGKKHSLETKEKISRSRIGISWGKHSIESRKKISISRKKNFHPLKGKPLTYECKRKISLKLKGRKVSEETKSKLRGQKRSKETRDKMSISAKLGWEMRKRK